MTTTNPSPALLKTLDGGVLTLTLNRPEEGNLIDAEISRAIVEALGLIDDAVRVVCLRGAGSDFCAGRRSPTPAKGGPVPSAEELRRLVALPALALYDAMKATAVPVVAVVQGRAHGVGGALAGLCDITIATEESSFAIPEMDRDIPPTLVMAALCDRVPLKTLAYLVLTRRVLSGPEALAAGLISRVVPSSDLEEESHRTVTSIAACSAVALRACKQYLQLAPGMAPLGANAFAGHMVATALSARY